MLAGALEDDRGAESSARRARRPRLIAITCTLLAVALFAASVATDAVPAVGAFFGIGALLLIACLAFFRAKLAVPARTANDRVRLDPSRISMLWGDQSPWRRALRRATSQFQVGRSMAHSKNGGGVRV